MLDVRSILSLLGCSCNLTCFRWWGCREINANLFASLLFEFCSLLYWAAFGCRLQLPNVHRRQSRLLYPYSALYLHCISKVLDNHSFPLMVLRKGNVVSKRGDEGCYETLLSRRSPEVEQLFLLVDCLELMMGPCRCARCLILCLFSHICGQVVSRFCWCHSVIVRGVLRCL